MEFALWRCFSFVSFSLYFPTLWIVLEVGSTKEELFCRLHGFQSFNPAIEVATSRFSILDCSILSSVNAAGVFGVPLLSICVVKLRKSSPYHPISQPLSLIFLTWFSLWNCHINISYELSQSLCILFLWESLSLSFLTPSSVCLRFYLQLFLSGAFSLSVSLSSFSTPSLAPSQIHLCLLSSLHVVAAIFSPYLEPDILSLLMILKRTPGRFLPDHAWSPLSDLPTYPFHSNPQPPSLFLRKSLDV